VGFDRLLGHVQLPGDHSVGAAFTTGNCCRAIG
jgi:hypothetical protein